VGPACQRLGAGRGAAGCAAAAACWAATGPAGLQWREWSRLGHQVENREREKKSVFYLKNPFCKTSSNHFEFKSKPLISETQIQQHECINIFLTL